MQKNLRLARNSFMDTGLPKTTAEYAEIRSVAQVYLRQSKRKDQIQNKRLQRCSTPPPLVSLSSLSLTSLDSIKCLRNLSSTPSFNYLELLQCQPNAISILGNNLNSHKDELIYEVLWCFGNLTLGPPILVEQISFYIQRFVDVLVSGNKTLAEQACWVLGNIAAESEEKRNFIRGKTEALSGMVNLLTLKNMRLASVAAWALCNLIRGEKLNYSDLFQTGALNAALDLIIKPFSGQVTEGLWLVSYLSAEPYADTRTQVYTNEKLEVFKAYLEFDDSKVVLPIIRILGNGFLYGFNLDYLFTDPIFVYRVIRVFKIHEKQVKTETMWMLSNLFTCGYTEIIMKYAGEDLIKCLLSEAKDDDQVLKTEAGIALYNLSETLNCSYFFQVLTMGKMFLLNTYVQNIANVPTWLSLNINSTIDVNLLQVSLGFVILCLEVPDIPYELHRYIHSDEVKEVVEDCLHTMRKSRPGTQDEKFIVQQCDYILNWFAHELSNTN